MVIYIKNKLRSYPINHIASRPVSFSSSETNLSVCTGNVLHRTTQWATENCLQPRHCIQMTLHSGKTACSYVWTWIYVTISNTVYHVFILGALKYQINPLLTILEKGSSSLIFFYLIMVKSNPTTVIPRLSW